MGPLSFVTEAPIWVWPLFGVLLFLGLRARRDREAKITLFWAQPLIALLPLSRVIGGAPPVITFASFAAAALLGVLWGHRFQGRITQARRGRIVVLKREWMTLAALMALFWLNYAQGVLGDVAPEILASPISAAAFAGLGGVLTGQFAGRTASILRTPDGFGKVGAASVAP